MMPENLEANALHEIRSKLEGETKRAFTKVAEALYDSVDLQEELYTRLLKVSNTLKVKSVTNEELLLSELDLISINGLISKEEHIRKEEGTIQRIVPVLIFFYILSISLVIFWGSQSLTSGSEIPLLGIPVSVALWAAIGSLAAILYRFYTQRPERIRTELKWLIARPIIGIIMGSLEYLAILSGLIVFGTNQTGTPDSLNNTRPQLLWMLAFLGGFSDRFFESLIKNVMGKLTATPDDKNKK